MEQLSDSGDSDLAATPEDITEWLRLRGWEKTAFLGDIAQRWSSGREGVVVPTLTSSPDFALRWREMLGRLSAAFDTDPGGVLSAAARAGSDVTEFRASGQIDDSLPLGDAVTLVGAVRRAVQASANAALQPRSYFGRSVPAAARDYARNVRMGQTRRGSYIVPVISRLPVLEPDDADDAMLFDAVALRPFARTAMLNLAKGLDALHELTHGRSDPSRSSITEAVGDGVSSELCDAVANTLGTDSITRLDVNFSWADRLPAVSAPSAVGFESEAVPALRFVGDVLKGQPVVGRQTFVGYVKRLDRGEDDAVGRITLRALDSDKARNIQMELDDSDYHVAGEANTDRRVVSVTGVLHREPGHALRFTDVTEFHLLDELPPATPPAR